MINCNKLVHNLRMVCLKGYPPPDPIKRPTVETPLLNLRGTRRTSAGTQRRNDSRLWAILAATRAGGRPGSLTQREAPPTATPPLPPNPDVEDGTSPLKTKVGTIRGPPAQPKRRKPPHNRADIVTPGPTHTTQRGRPPTRDHGGPHGY